MGYIIWCQIHERATKFMFLHKFVPLEQVSEHMWIMTHM
jgi:hypothetical protein